MLWSHCHFYFLKIISLCCYFVFIHVLKPGLTFITIELVNKVRFTIFMFFLKIMYYQSLCCVSLCMWEWFNTGFCSKVLSNTCK